MALSCLFSSYRWRAYVKKVSKTLIWSAKCSLVGKKPRPRRCRRGSCSWRRLRQWRPWHKRSATRPLPRAAAAAHATMATASTASARNADETTLCCVQRAWRRRHRGAISATAAESIDRAHNLPRHPRPLLRPLLNHRPRVRLPPRHASDRQTLRLVFRLRRAEPMVRLALTSLRPLHLTALAPAASSDSARRDWGDATPSYFSTTSHAPPFFPPCSPTRHGPHTPHT